MNDLGEVEISPFPFPESICVTYLVSEITVALALARLGRETVPPWFGAAPMFCHVYVGASADWIAPRYDAIWHHVRRQMIAPVNMN